MVFLICQNPRLAFQSYTKKANLFSLGVILANRARKMVNLAIEETSGVDHPAHLHEGWLVMKSADESEVQRVLDETLTEEDSNMEETTTTATDAQVEKAEMTLEEAMSKIADLEAKLSEMEMAKE